MAADGHTYERRFIEGWLQERGPVSPVTRAPLAHSNLAPNKASIRPDVVAHSNLLGSVQLRRWRTRTSPPTRQVGGGRRRVGGAERGGTQGAWGGREGGD